MITQEQINELSITKLLLFNTLYYAVKYSSESRILSGLHKRDIEETSSCGMNDIRCVDNGLSTYLIINGVHCYDEFAGEP